MKGRGNPNQGRGHGRGYFGARGGRGSPANDNHLKGNIPTIGAYLDLPPGKDIVPGSVTKWMVKIKEYSMTNFKTRISLIFGADGTLGDYPVYLPPDNLADGATAIERKIALNTTNRPLNLKKTSGTYTEPWSDKCPRVPRSGLKRCRPVSKPKQSLSQGICCKQSLPHT